MLGGTQPSLQALEVLWGVQHFVSTLEVFLGLLLIIIPLDAHESIWITMTRLGSRLREGQSI